MAPVTGALRVVGPAVISSRVRCVVAKVDGRSSITGRGGPSAWRGGAVEGEVRGTGVVLAVGGTGTAELVDTVEVIPPGNDPTAPLVKDGGGLDGLFGALL